MHPEPAGELGAANRTTPAEHRPLMIKGMVPRSGPSGTISLITFRLAALGAGAATLGAVHLPRPETLCPTRALTGVPCPVCGTTTALARLGRLDLPGALAANPVTLSALVALLIAPTLTRRAPLPYLLLAAGVSEVWQLVRFDLL